MSGFSQLSHRGRLAEDIILHSSSLQYNTFKTNKLTKAQHNGLGKKGDVLMFNQNGKGFPRAHGINGKNISTHNMTQNHISLCIGNGTQIVLITMDCCLLFRET